MMSKVGKAWVPPTKVCRCGRAFQGFHCYECGSRDVLAIRSESKVIAELSPSGEAIGEPTLIRMLRCRRCGARFFEDSICKAPEKVELPSREMVSHARRELKMKACEIDPSSREAKKQILEAGLARIPAGSPLRASLEAKLAALKEDSARASRTSASLNAPHGDKLLAPLAQAGLDSILDDGSQDGPPASWFGDSPDEE